MSIVTFEVGTLSIERQEQWCVVVSTPLIDIKPLAKKHGIASQVIVDKSLYLHEKEWERIHKTDRLQLQNGQLSLMNVLYGGDDIEGQYHICIDHDIITFLEERRQYLAEFLYSDNLFFLNCLVEWVFLSYAKNPKVTLSMSLLLI